MANLMTIKLNKNAGASWGFRLQGGKDFATPLCIQKVNGGSIAEQFGLQAGDAIVSINNQDALTFRHKEAQDAIVRAGNGLDIVVQRGSQIWRPNVTALPEIKTLPGGVPVATKTSLAANKPPVRFIGSNHNCVPRPFPGAFQNGFQSTTIRTVTPPVPKIQHEECNNNTLSSPTRTNEFHSSPSSGTTTTCPNGNSSSKNVFPFPHLNLEEATSCLTITGTDVSLNKENARNFLRMTLDKENLNTLDLLQSVPKTNGSNRSNSIHCLQTSLGASRSNSSSSVGSTNGLLLNRGFRKHSYGSNCSSVSSTSSQDGDAESNKDVNNQQLVNAQYNTPLHLYSDDSIAETLSAQAEVLGKGVLGINFNKYAREEKIRTDSPTYKLLHGEDEPVRRPRHDHHAALQNESGSHLPFQRDPMEEYKATPPSQSTPPAAPHGNIHPGENICSGCQRLIVGVFVRIKNKNLHAECFKCATCGTSLKNVGYYNINEKLYCDIHAKQAARSHPPAPNMEPITVQPGSAPPPGAVTTSQAMWKGPASFQVKGPAPVPLPARVTAPVPAPHQPSAPVPMPIFTPAPAPVVAPPMKTAQAPSHTYQSTSGPGTFGAPAGGIDVRSHIPKKGAAPVQTYAPVAAPVQNYAPVAAPVQNYAPVAAPVQNYAPVAGPVPASVTGFGSDGMPKPTPPPSVGGIFKMGGPARGIPQAPGQRTGPRRGRGVMNQASASRIPVCANCQRQIRGPFVSALGKTWCPDHFICATSTCKKPIIDMGFVEEKGGLYCENCYESYLAPICGKCDKRIKGDCLNAVGKQFHPECFCCAYCGKVFGSGAFYLEDGLPYCEADWNDLFTTKCVGCNFPIEAGDRWVEALNNNYHSQCFKCSKCNKNLEGQSFFAKGGKPFCKAHAQRGF